MLVHGLLCAEANRAAVGAKGGIEAVVVAMRRHEGAAGVAEAGCWALYCIALLGGCCAVVCERAVCGAAQGRAGPGVAWRARASARGGVMCVRW